MPAISRKLEVKVSGILKFALLESLENIVREVWIRKALDAGNQRYADAIAQPGSLYLTSRGDELILSADLAYNWVAFEKGEEEIDLKQILLNGPKARSILPKMNKNGTIRDPGGKWNIIPFEGGATFRTVSTPRFDNRGRFIGSSPTSWIIPAKSTHNVLDDAILEVLPLIQSIIDVGELAEL